MNLTCQMILWELTVIHKDATVMTEPEKIKIRKKKSSGAMEHIDILSNSNINKF